MLARVARCGKPASSNLSTRSDQGLGIPTRPGQLRTPAVNPAVSMVLLHLPVGKKLNGRGGSGGRTWGWTWGNVGALEIVESPEKSGPRATSVFHPRAPSRQRAPRDHGLRIIAHVSARNLTTQRRSVQSNPTSTQF